MTGREGRLLVEQIARAAGVPTPATSRALRRMGLSQRRWQDAVLVRAAHCLLDPRCGRGPFAAAVEGLLNRGVAWVVLDGQTGDVAGDDPAAASRWIVELGHPAVTIPLAAWAAELEALRPPTPASRAVALVREQAAVGALSDDDRQALLETLREP